jgi:hypothetical protein
MLRTGKIEVAIIFRCVASAAGTGSIRGSATAPMTWL